ncbi:tyrosine-type recombinase/integrase [Chromohalobacter moromii]|uniref:Tyrosine-type recombinase/integrase n=1 Tax=Chromohalobacter moromii TaxID=2860329 RepID=A0A9X2X3W9_9GAMM|nr:tyrosine-type recombinase/integrase [Chromohalobacter moromii]MCT8506118.1 tyrosine-type recombinase/integrase [Chromohalobacter moromii]
MKRSQIKRRPLADTVLASLEPEGSDYRELDGNGLYLQVRKNGSKSWNLRYKRPTGNWAWMGLGPFPRVSGKAARKEAQRLNAMAADGIDLRVYKESVQEQHLFETAAEDWYQSKLVAGRSPGTTEQMRRYLDSDILPVIGKKTLGAVTRADCTKIQEGLEKRGAHNVAKKTRSWINQIFSRAIAQGKCELNPASELRHIAAEAPKTTHYPHLLEPDLPDFLQALRGSNSRVISRTAVWMVLRTASRPGMVRLAEWSEFDLDEALWSIPADKMKMRRDHLVPLSRQSVDDLRRLHEITGRSRWVFPGNGPKNPTLSENTINKVIAMVGYKGKLVGHGSRHTASTLLREHGWHKDLVEAQLAHKEHGIAGIYNQAAYLSKRRKMMQWYSDYLDALECGMNDELLNIFNGRVIGMGASVVEI